MSRVIIYGMSHAGLRIASFLQEAGSEVIVAVPQGSGFIQQLERLQVQVMAGDLEDLMILRTLGIDKAQSIILPSEDDLFNLNTALQAVEINCNIRLVLRLFNLNLGKKLEKSVKNFTVLSVSQLASLSFVTAALLEKPLLSFQIGEEIVSLYDVNRGVLSGKSVAELELEQEVKVLAVNDDVFPGDRVVGPGDRLTLFSRFRTASDLCGVRACQAEGGKRSKEDAKKDFFGSIRRLDKVLLRTIAALASVAALSILFFHTTERLSFLDAGYFVVTVLTTTGFGDISLKDSSALSKVVGICLMLSGMALMAMLFAIISDNLLKKRLELFLGRRRIKIRDHVILCGVGDVGIRILEDLVRIKQTVVVVEKNPEGRFVNSVRQQNVPLIVSDAKQEETLLNANIREAKAIICATDNDMRNLEIGLNARGLNPGIRVVLRTFDKDFAARVEKHFGIHMALSSSAIAAPAFASASRNTASIGVVDLGGRRLKVKEAVLSGPSELKASMGKNDLKVLMVVHPNGKIVLHGIENCVEQGSKMIYLTEF